jgi:hypothetical protein
MDSFSLQATQSLIAAVESLLPRLNVLASTKRAALAVDPPRIFALLRKIGEINAAIAQLNESPTSLSGDFMELIVAKVVGFVSLTTKSGSTIQFDTTTPVNVSIVEWGTGLFPYDSSLSGQIITVDIGRGTVIDVTFNYDSSAGSTLTCGIYDPATLRWQSSMCQLTQLPGSRVECKCDASATPEGSPMHIGLLFGTIFDQPPNGDNNTPPSNGGAIAAGIIVAIIVVAALVVAGFFFVRRREQKRKEQTRMSEAFSRITEAERIASTPRAGTSDDEKRRSTWQKGERDTVALKNM